MSKRMKQLLSVVLAAFLLVSSVPIETSTANAMENTKEAGAGEGARTEETFDFKIHGEFIESVTQADVDELQAAHAERSELFQASKANKNVTDQISHTTTIWLNGQKYTGGPIQVKKGDNFSYEYMWSPKLNQGEVLGEGDYFEKVLFRVPHLTLTSHMSQNLNINGVKVGEWNLNYNATTGEMKFKVVFTKYIQLFDPDTIQMQMQGSGSFNALTSGNEEIQLDNFTGKIEIIERPVVPTPPPVVSGTGWTPPQPPVFQNESLQVGKGKRWDNHDHPNETPQMEWRIGFMEQLQNKQQEFVTTGKVTPFTGDCIIEETLDENMKYHFNPKENNGQDRFGNSPFHLELPVVVAGTSRVLNGPIGNTSYDGFGRISPYIRGGDLTMIDGSKAYTSEQVKAVQDQVRNTPGSWTVTTDPNTNKETLLINLGVLGGTDSAKGITWAQAKGDQRWPLEGLQSYIDECTNTINALDSGTNSPIALLDDRHQQVVNLLVRALQFPQNNTPEWNDKLQLWRDNYQAWYTNPKVGALKPLEENNELIVPLPDVTLLNAFLDMDVHGDGTKLRDVKEYKDFAISYNNLRNDQKIYLENRLSYKEQWKVAKERYTQTYNFYEEKPIYGFTLNCRTTSVNTSVEQYTNNVKISIGEQSWSASDSVQVQFSNRVTGSFSLGSLVVQKADHKYDVIDQTKDEQTQQKDNINQVGKDKAGIPGVKFKVYCETEDGKFVQDDKHLVKFLDKNASPNKDTYVFRANSGDVTEVVTDENGKIVLGGLSPQHAHYLVETGSPQGYYQDAEPIRLQVEKDKVIYRLVPNTSRAVKLVKQDAHSKHVIAGAEFQLKKGNQVITGFRKKTVKGREVLVPDANGTEKLLTNAQGELCIHNLDAGSYTLQEIKAAPGYVLPNTPKVITFDLKDQFDANQLHMDPEKHLLLNEGKPVENEPKTASVTINKIEGNQKTPLQGAAFALFQFTGTEEEWKQTPNDVKKWEIVTFAKDSKGYFQTTQTIEKVTLPNAPIGTTAFDAALTGQDGTVTVTNIPLGHYSVAEVQPPALYHRDENNYYFHVTPDTVDNPMQIYRGFGADEKEVVDNTIVNYQRLSQIKLVKGDAQAMPHISGTAVNEGHRYEGAVVTGKGLAGATYKLFRQEGSTGTRPNEAELTSKTIVGTAGNTDGKTYDSCLAVGTTNADGILELKDMRDAKGQVIPGLHMDRYYMIEVEAPVGYRLNQTPIMITLDSDVYPRDAQNEITQEGTPGLVVSAVNQKYKYGIKLLKKDQTSQKPLEKVGFELQKADGTIVKVTKPTGSTRYMVDEKSGRATMYTDAKGELFIGGLEPGTNYTLKETQVPSGYQAIPDFVVTTPTSVQDGMENDGFLYTEKTVMNERKVGKVELHKQDEEDGHALAGAKFQLYQVKEEVIPQGDPDYDPNKPDATRKVEVPLGAPKVTDQEGNLFFDQLEWGSYCIREIEAPKGYVLNSKPLSFIIGATNHVKDGMLTVRFPYVKNSKMVGEAKLIKKDFHHSNVFLPNAEFALKKKVMMPDNTEQWVPYGKGTYKTDSSGEILFRLPPGEYKVIETKAPEGYDLPTGQDAETLFTITEDASGNVPTPITVSITNKKSKIPVTGVATGAVNSMVLFGIGLGGAILLAVVMFQRRRGRHE